MMLLSRATLPYSSVKTAVNTYMQLPQLTSSVSRVGPYIKKDEKTDLVTMITLYDLSNLNSKDIMTVKDELQTRTIEAAKAIPKVKCTIEEYKSVEEFLLPLVNKK